MSWPSRSQSVAMITISQDFSLQLGGLVAAGGGPGGVQAVRL